MNWSRQSLWLAPRAHPLVEVFVQVSKARKVFVETTVGGPALAYLSDHRVNSRAILPGTAFMEMSAAAARSLVTEASNSCMLALGGVSIRFPLELPDSPEVSTARTPGPAVQVVMDLRASKYEVQSARRHASSAYVTGGASMVHVADAPSLRAGSAPQFAQHVLCKLSFSRAAVGDLPLWHVSIWASSPLGTLATTPFMQRWTMACSCRGHGCWA